MSKLNFSRITAVLLFFCLLVDPATAAQNPFSTTWERASSTGAREDLFANQAMALPPGTISRNQSAKRLAARTAQVSRDLRIALGRHVLNLEGELPLDWVKRSIDRRVAHFLVVLGREFEDDYGIPNITEELFGDLQKILDAFAARPHLWGSVLPTSAHWRLWPVMPLYEGSPTVSNAQYRHWYQSGPTIRSSESAALAFAANGAHLRTDFHKEDIIDISADAQYLRNFGLPMAHLLHELQNKGLSNAEDIRRQAEFYVRCLVGGLVFAPGHDEDLYIWDPVQSKLNSEYGNMDYPFSEYITHFNFLRQDLWISSQIDLAELLTLSYEVFSEVFDESTDSFLLFANAYAGKEEITTVYEFDSRRPVSRRISVSDVWAGYSRGDVYRKLYNRYTYLIAEDAKLIQFFRHVIRFLRSGGIDFPPGFTPVPLPPLPPKHSEKHDTPTSASTAERSAA